MAVRHCRPKIGQGVSGKDSAMLILLLVCVLLAFWLQYRIYRRYWYRKLEIVTRFEDSYAYEGDMSCLKEEIVNDKRMPLPAVEVRLSMSRNLLFMGEAKENTNVTDLSYKRDIFSLFLRQKVIRTLPFVCKKRGFYQIRQAEVVGSDFFFEKEFYLTVPQQTQMYVYPAQIDVRRIELICQAVSGMVLVQNHLYPDPFEFAGIREYRPGDPMRQINWKASARSEDMMVNQYDSTTNIQATVILDVEDSGILKYDALTEEAIRIAASLVARMIRGKMELQIVSNAVYQNHDREEPQEEKLSLHMKAGGGRLQELNRRLACVDTARTTETVCEVIEKEIQKHNFGQIYVVISKNQTEAVQKSLRLLANAGQIVWVVPVYPDMELTVSGSREIRVMRWEVEPC